MVVIKFTKIHVSTFEIGTKSIPSNWFQILWNLHQRKEFLLRLCLSSIGFGGYKRRFGVEFGGVNFVDPCGVLVKMVYGWTLFARSANV